MTRENKVALVVGFALVLLVGILISDYLSKAQTQRSADLLAADEPGDGGRRALDQAGLPAPRRVRLTDLQQPRRTPVQRPQLGTPPMPPAETAAVSGSEQPLIQQVSLTNGPVRPPLPAPEVPTQRTHTVRSGESLSEICVRYYGDVSLMDRLAKTNGLDDPDQVRAGTRLSVPAAKVLAGPVPVQATVPVQSRQRQRQDAANYQTYTVRPGDSLSGLAARFLDSAAAWQQLYELNREVIHDPDRIQSGLTIRVPS
jgi:nucleoid-associated protein YgaU